MPHKTINEYGVYYVEDEEQDLPGITDKYEKKFNDNDQLIIHEGRNGSDDQGPRGKYDGFTALPATEQEYKIYLIQKKYEKFGKEWISKYNGRVHWTPSLGKLKMENKILRLLRYSITSYDRNYTEKLDENVQVQKQVMELFKKAKQFTIVESIKDDKKKQVVINNVNNIIEDLNTLENTQVNSVNKKIDEIVFLYVKLNVVLKSKEYYEKYKKSAKDHDYITLYKDLNLQPSIESLKKCLKINADGWNSLWMK